MHPGPKIRGNLKLYSLLLILGFSRLEPIRGQQWPVEMPYRVSIAVDATGCEEVDRVVSLPLNFSELLGLAGSGLPFAPECLRLVEIDSRGRLLDAMVVFQFDSNQEEATERGTGGVLSWLMRARTGGSAVRRYQLYFSDRSRSCTPVQFEPLVRIEDAGFYRGDRAWRIWTEAAVYYYHRKGSGFASLIDREGNDWISYYPEGGPKGNFRGIPNIAPAGFHPGPGEGNKESRIVAAGPLRVRILSETGDGRWGLFWDVFPWHATMRLFKKGPPPYWILYEGTPGGEFDLEDYWVDSSGRRFSVAPYEGVQSAWHGELPDPQWVYFGDPRVQRVLFLYLHEKESAIAEFWHFGRGGMTVFGFGRGPKEGGWQRLQRIPAEFTFGFLETVDFRQIGRTIACRLSRVAVQLTSPERRR